MTPRPAVALLALAAAAAPCEGLPSRVRGREILADGEPVVFKGVNWNPVAAGKTQKDGVDFRGFVEADSALMAAAGINVLRTYSPIMDREVLDILWQRRIHVLNTVYVAAHHEVQSAARPVQELKDHPAILMWCVGNEWNYNQLYSSTLLFTDALERVAEVSSLIKKLDPTHLVATVYGMLPPPNQIEALPDVDVWGLTAYTGISLGNLFQLWGDRTRKPFFIAEFGADAYNAKAQVEDEASQALATTRLAREISSNSVANGGVCSGGLIFELADEWWKDGEGSPDRQDVGGIAPGGGPYPDHVFNEEYWGLVQIDGSPRQAFGAYAALHPVGTGANKIGAGFRLRACGASPLCSGILGDCCPTREGKVLGCCSAEARGAAQGSSQEEETAEGEKACVVERNVDYVGGDLHSVPAVTSAEKCAMVCGREPLCKSFTYGKVGYFAQHCFLKKSRMPGRSVSSCCDSGVPCPQETTTSTRTTPTSTSSTTRPPETTSTGTSTGARTTSSTSKATTLRPATVTTTSLATLTSTTRSTTSTTRSTTPTTTSSTSTTPERTKLSKVCKIDDNHDYLGDDLTSVMYVGSAEACATLCSAHPACKSFSYAKKIQGCFFKSSVRPGRISSGCCASGEPCAQACLMERGFYYSGDDLAEVGNVHSAEACAKLCDREHLCRSFTYGKTGHQAQVCYLKSSVMPGRTASQCCDSGLPCSTPAPTPTPKPSPAPATSTEAPEPEGTRIGLEVTSRHEFVAYLGIGNPPQEMRCLLDSGSADIWIPSMRCRSCGSLNTFQATSSRSFAPEAPRSTSIGSLRWPKSVRLSIGGGEVVGYPVKDTVRLGELGHLEVKNQSFIIVEDSTMPPRQAWDGICGLGWRQLGKVHHPLYTRIQDQKKRALFALVPQGPGRASLVVGAVPQEEVKGELVWVRAESFQPGTMSQWVQRSFWVTTGGLQIHKATPASVRFLIDTGVSEAVLAPPKHYRNLITSLLPLGAFKGTCSVAQSQVSCDCSILKEHLLPLQIHLGGQPFLIPVAELFSRVQAGPRERCMLQVRPNPEASASQTGALEGIGGMLGGLVGNVLGGSHAGGAPPGPPPPVVPPTLPPQAHFPPQQPSTLMPAPWRLTPLGQPSHGPHVHDLTFPLTEEEADERRLDESWKHLMTDLLAPKTKSRSPSWTDEDDPLDELWVLGGMFVERFVTVFDFDKALLGFGLPATRATAPDEAARPARVGPEAFERLEEVEPAIVVAAPGRPWPSVAMLAAAAFGLLLFGSWRFLGGSRAFNRAAYRSLVLPRRQAHNIEIAECSEEVRDAHSRGAVGVQGTLPQQS